jgi:hypothetical protein
MKRTTIYIDDVKLNKLKVFSSNEKISMSDAIRIAIDNMLESKPIQDDKVIHYKDIIGIAEGSEVNNVSEKVEEFLKENFRK